MDRTMRAAVAEQAGMPEVLRIRDLPVPRARQGWTLVRVEAFGLNRSELMTRQGHSPNVRFPRILGIECVGVVEESLDPALPPGTTVGAVMGEMGREFDGGYAQYALLPDKLLIPVNTSLDWPAFAALPETWLTAYGSLEALRPTGGGPLLAGGALLVRGGTSSVGLASLALAREHGLTTIATTRNPDKIARLREQGADQAIVDSGDADALTRQVQAIRPGGPEYVLDLVGANTVLESLRLVAPGGTVCMTGMLSQVWAIPDFQPTATIPSGAKLTVFQSEDISGAAGREPLQRIVDSVAAGRYRPNVDRVFGLDDIVAAHQYMEHNCATGKVVVRPW